MLRAHTLLNPGGPEKPSGAANLSRVPLHAELDLRPLFAGGYTGGLTVAIEYRRRRHFGLLRSFRVEAPCSIEIDPDLPIKAIYFIRDDALE